MMTRLRNQILLANEVKASRDQTDTPVLQCYTITAERNVFLYFYLFVYAIKNITT